MSFDFTSFLKKFSSLTSGIKTAKSAETGIKASWTLLLLLCLVTLVLGGLMALFIYLSESAEPEALTEAELKALIYALDGKSWKCSKADRTKIESLFGVDSAGYMETERVNNTTMAVTLDDLWRYDVFISEEKGCLVLFYGLYEYPLYYSEDTALVLVWEDTVITWELL